MDARPEPEPEPEAEEEEDVVVLEGTQVELCEEDDPIDADEFCEATVLAQVESELVEAPKKAASARNRNVLGHRKPKRIGAPPRKPQWKPTATSVRHGKRPRPRRDSAYEAAAAAKKLSARAQAKRDAEHLAMRHAETLPRPQVPATQTEADMAAEAWRHYVHWNVCASTTEVCLRARCFYTASQALGVVTMGDWFAFHIEKKRHKLSTVLAALHLALDTDVGVHEACRRVRSDWVNKHGTTRDAVVAIAYHARMYPFTYGAICEAIETRRAPLEAVEEQPGWVDYGSNAAPPPAPDPPPPPPPPPEPAPTLDADVAGRKFGHWTTAEDEFLRTVVAQNATSAGYSWARIAAAFPNRTQHGVAGRWQRLQILDQAPAPEPAPAPAPVPMSLMPPGYAPPSARAAAPPKPERKPTPYTIRTPIDLTVDKPNEPLPMYLAVDQCYWTQRNAWVQEAAESLATARDRFPKMAAQQQNRTRIILAIADEDRMTCKLAKTNADQKKLVCARTLLDRLVDETASVDQHLTNLYWDQHALLLSILDGGPARMLLDTQTSESGRQFMAGRSEAARAELAALCTVMVESREGAQGDKTMADVQQMKRFIAEARQLREQWNSRLEKHKVAAPEAAAAPKASAASVCIMTASVRITAPSNGSGGAWASDLSQTQGRGTQLDLGELKFCKLDSDLGFRGGELAPGHYFAWTPASHVEQGGPVRKGYRRPVWVALTNVRGIYADTLDSYPFGDGFQARMRLVYQGASNAKGDATHFYIAIDRETPEACQEALQRFLQTIAPYFKAPQVILQSVRLSERDGGAKVWEPWRAA